MKTQVRILLAAALIVLAAGWMGLRGGNAALARQLVHANPAAGQEVTP